MIELFENNPDILKVFLIGLFFIIGLIILIIANKLKWLSGFSIGKGGVEVKGVEKQFQSGTFNKLLDDQIQKLDTDLANYAISKANQLRRNFTRELIKNVSCVATHRALSSVLRFPIYEACRNNNFKLELKPENIKYYIGRIMREIIGEYEDFGIQQNQASCPIADHSCVSIPPAIDIFSDLEKHIINEWALPIRKKLIEICESKIKLYKQFIQSYMEIGDQVRIKIAEHCIDKNKNYISALKRNPEINEA